LLEVNNTHKYLLLYNAIYASLSMQNNRKDRSPRGSGHDIIGIPIVQSNNFSKDEYIAKLKAQLRGFIGESSKPTSSRAVLHDDSVLRRHEENDRDSVRSTAMFK